MSLDRRWVEVRQAVERTTGIRLPDVMKARALSSLRKLERREGTDLRELDARVCKYIVDTVGIGTTWFYREFDGLASMVAGLPANIGRRPRFWTIGCSSGEEPYTLAMLLLSKGFTPSILATDVNRLALNKAERGIYTARSTAKLPPGWRDAYFDQHPDGFVVTSELRSAVRFVEHNIARDSIPPSGWSEFDGIVCRNVLMYFDFELAREIASRVRNLCRPQAQLLLGAVESDLGGELSFSVSTVASVLAPPAPTLEIPTLPALAPKAKAAEVVVGAHADEHVLRRYAARAKSNPLDFEAHLMCGVLRYHFGVFKGAIAALRKARFLNGEAWLAAYCLGRCLEKQGRVVEARDAYRHALQVLEADGESGLPREWSDLAVSANEARRKCLAGMR